MEQPQFVISSRLPAEWQHTVPCNPVKPVPNPFDPLQLLSKLADHPDGLKLLESYQKLLESHHVHRDVRYAQRPIVELVKGRASSRLALIEALEQAQKQLIITSPWLSKRSVDSDLVLRITALLDRGCYLHIGWGYSRDIKGIHPNGNIIHISDTGQCSINVTADSCGNYSAFLDLVKLTAKYTDQFQMKLMGTHEKYIICDDQFAVLGSHNTLSSLDTLFAPREIGWRTTDKTLIATQTEDFFSAADLRHNFGLQTPLISLSGEYIDPEQVGNPKLIATAKRVVKQRGIVNSPNFKVMRNSDIQSFIDSYTPAVGIPNMSC